MDVELRYGESGLLRFDPAEIDELIECRTAARALADLSAAVETALTQPLGFPSLQEAVLPGDKVVVALDRQVPQSEAIVQAVVDLLTCWGVAPNDITILVPEATADVSEHQPQVLVHNPAKRDQMAYLAATPTGEALYLNRVLCDADVVLPIASVQMQARSGKSRAADGLYPVFSAKPQANGKPKSEKHPEKLDVSWLLGVQCSVQVVPGPGESVQAVIAGDPQTVRRASRRLCEQTWRFDVPHRSDLVVAAIEGDASQHSWEQVSRALAAATEVVGEDGAIAICCDLDQAPGPGLQALSESDDPFGAIKQIRKQHLPDVQLVQRLVRARQQARVYLLSRLDEDLVESLSMAPVSSAAEVQRLAQRHASCLLLANAQHAVAAAQE